MAAKRFCKWYFEVWNEPNLWFFFNSTKSKYFRTVSRHGSGGKGGGSRLKVGGPATSNFVPDDRFEGEKQEGDKAITHQLKNLGEVEWRGVWIEEFLEFCDAKSCPSISCRRIPIRRTFHSDTTSPRCAPDHQTPR